MFTIEETIMVNILTKKAAGLIDKLETSKYIHNEIPHPPGWQRFFFT